MNLAESRSHVPLVNFPKMKKKPKSIRKVAKKRVKVNKEYMELRAAFLTRHPYCQWYLSENSIKQEDINPNGWVRAGHSASGLYPPLATEIHHLKGRGKFLLDASTWMAVSEFSHRAIHANPKESYAKGYMLPRR